jgi:hypothetical protein
MTETLCSVAATASQHHTSHAGSIRKCRGGEERIHSRPREMFLRPVVESDPTELNHMAVGRRDIDGAGDQGVSVGRLDDLQLLFFSRTYLTSSPGGLHFDESRRR